MTRRSSRVWSSSEWQREGEQIVRDWQFKDFAAGDRVRQPGRRGGRGQANHHPDILVHGWNKVRLSVTNHSAGGLTQADFELARKVDDLA